MTFDFLIVALLPRPGPSPGGTSSVQRQVDGGCGIDRGFLGAPPRPRLARGSRPRVGPGCSGAGISRPSTAPTIHDPFRNPHEPGVPPGHDGPINPSTPINPGDPPPQRWRRPHRKHGTLHYPLRPPPTTIKLHNPQGSSNQMSCLLTDPQPTPMISSFTEESPPRPPTPQRRRAHSSSSYSRLRECHGPPAPLR